MKTDLFQSCGHCWIFQICWHIECNSVAASSFRILNSSADIPSSPLPLFVEMLSKARLASHSRMSSCRLVITPSWLFGSLRPFWYSSSVYSYYLLLSSASVRSHTVSVLYCYHLCMKRSLGIFGFLEEISSLFPFCCFPLFLFIVHLERLFSLLAVLWSSAFLFSFAFHFLSQPFVRPDL